MVSECETISCPSACPESDENFLPEVDYSKCSPVVNVAEIDRLFIGNIGSPFTDEGSAPEWATRIAIAFDDDDPDYLMQLLVVGQKPAAEGSPIKIDSDNIITPFKKHTITGKIFQTNHTNYEAMRALECGGKRLIWYTTAGGKLYGGASGIEASIVINHVIPEGRNELAHFEFSIEWNAKFHPCECVSPI